MTLPLFRFATLTLGVWAAFSFGTKTAFAQVQQVIVAARADVVNLDVANADDDGEDDDDDEKPRQQQEQFEIDPSNFDQWVFGNVGNRDAGIQRMNSMLELRCDAVDRACSLSPEQKDKIQLAGRGDIQRYLNQVELVRDKFMAVRKDQNRFNQIWQDISPLQQRLNSGFFNDDTMLVKIIRGTLTPEQTVIYDQVELERRMNRFRAKVELVVASMETNVPMTDAQREKFIELIVSQSPPPRRFGQYDFYLVLYRAAQIPESKWTTILDKPQYDAFRGMLQQGRGMEAFLRQNGFLDEVKKAPEAKPNP